MLLSGACEWRVDLLLPKLSELNEIMLELQSNDCTLHQAWAYFELVLDLYPMFKARSEPNACMVHSPKFERGIIKIQDNSEEDLTTTENCVIRDL